MTSGGKSRAAGNGRRAGSTQLTPAQLARQASEDLGGLLGGRAPEAIVSLERTEEGWRVGLEFLEIRRIPDTADILAEYEVETDEAGRLRSYRRTRRYTRGRVEDTP